MTTLGRHLGQSITGNPVGAALACTAVLCGPPALFVAAILTDPVAFAIILTLTLVGEHHARWRAAMVLVWLGDGHLTMTTRAVARDIAAVVLLAGADGFPVPTLLMVVYAVTLIHVGRCAVLLGRRYIANRRRPVFATRNVDLGRLSIPDAPGRLVQAANRRRLLYLTLPGTVGAIVDTMHPTAGWSLVGMALGLLAVAIVFTATAVHAARNRHLGDRARYRQVVLDGLRAHRPQIVLYFSHEPRVANSTYQVDMWLSTLERSGRRFMVLVRERQHVERVAATTAPVVCIPGGADVVDLDIPSLRLALYTGNTGKNVHLLRHNTMRHVFIGHGDSDKASSANPFCTVYDEVWTAGRAGRDRFHDAGVRIRDSAIVEVGRPQLDHLTQNVPRRADEPFTVLYAPTWEGWSHDMMVSSLRDMGVSIVTALLGLRPTVRIIYKPHPLTGIRDRHHRLADARVRRLLCPDSHRGVPRRPTGPPVARRTGDALQRARDHHRTEPVDLDRGHRWSQYWRAGGPHHVVGADGPDLYDCFRQSDLLISDVSSVVSDFVATGKPYVLCDPTDLGAARFRARYPAGGGGYLLRSDCRALPEIVATVRDNRPDPMAAARAATRHHLLGPEHPSAQTRFTAAVDRIITAAQPTPPSQAVGPNPPMTNTSGAQR